MTVPEQHDGAAGFYPGSTEIKQHLSIFLLGFRHAVSDRKSKDWVYRARTLGWLPHPYLQSKPAGAEASCQGRLFAPHDVLTPMALRTIFGSTWGEGGSASFYAGQQILSSRLSSKEGKAKHAENLLLTRDPSRCGWFGRRLRAPKESGGAWLFFIEWADLWLFDDDSGVIALKTRLDEVVSDSDDIIVPTLTEISGFHRYLRDWQDPKIVVSKERTGGTEQRLWEEIVFNEWLGAGKPGLHLLMRDGEASTEVFDGFSRYCKLLTGVQVAELGTDEDEFAWSSPLADPMSGYPYRAGLYRRALRGPRSGGYPAPPRPATPIRDVSKSLLVQRGHQGLPGGGGVPPNETGHGGRRAVRHGFR